MVLSILFLLWTVPLLLLSGGTIIIEQGLMYAASEFIVRDIEPAALGYFNMSMLKPLWEELWIDILEIYLAKEKALCLGAEPLLGNHADYKRRYPGDLRDRHPGLGERLSADLFIPFLRPCRSGESIIRKNGTSPRSGQVIILIK
jgi:hypothetical protein